MCDKAVTDHFFLQNVTDWFVTQQQIKLWYEGSEYHDDDNEIIEWYEGHQKRKARKAKIKEELMPVAWHPDRAVDWCMSEDEKRLWK